ncbi:hypothetical protein M409DRAFT_24663 [Zasmidium cellare ATCC 36951]|uniref:Uncharacterized protein n=1 Tax=Zasmidium cellare ATCC 36951 TaxID=1080233 RepID=A0A6A6CF24_ZASCE|nr:uncharacterized protein M409DRAFT_24663 [Zasmidium cellare ATCC 36951]KAF2164758.1 hypothetical protein M409DRAFT_24663 [Zasmidium cellare ATCC 36951]
MSADEELDRRIQALPQEVQDEILDHVLFIKPGEVTINTTSYTPPWQLHFNRATREKIAEHYYATSVFKISDADYGCFSVTSRWLKSLTAKHQAKVADIRGDYRSGSLTFGALPAIEALYSEATERKYAFRKALSTSADLREQNSISLGRGVFKTNYFVFELCECGRGECPNYEIEEHWASECEGRRNMRAG